jgi:hypothetical protein
MIEHLPKEGGRIMTQLPSCARYDDWLVYAAFLPGLLTVSAIGVTAVAWHSQALWHAATLSVVRVDTDDYVEGLARLGIVKLPGYEPLPSVENVSPIVARQ